MTTTTATPTTDIAATVNAKTICLSIKFSRFGNAKQASMADVSVNADKALLRLTKTLLVSPELAAIGKLDSGVARWMRSKAGFSSLFKGGIWIVPLAQVEDIIAELERKREERALLVDIAVGAYAMRTAETSERLGVVHDAGDYPSEARFRASFEMEWQLITFDTPAKLKAISPKLFEAEKQKAALKLQSVAEECQQALRAGMLTLIDNITERLTPGPDGKPKQFQKATIEALDEFLATFALRNVTDDDQLDALVKQAREVIHGVDAKTLRADDLVRESVLNGFSRISDALAPLVSVKPERLISFDDEAGLAVSNF